MASEIKISFQTIVFNGLSNAPSGLFEACLKNIYPFAHEMIIAEGAVLPTVENKGDASWATSDGHSTDGTLDFLRSFPDPEHKIRIITTNGFWRGGKVEMFNEMAKQTTGDYAWEIDGDELYNPVDMDRLIRLLDGNRQIERVDFYARQFFGGWDHCIEPLPGPWINQIEWRRIFKTAPGGRYLSHTPPIYADVFGRIMGVAPGILWGRDFTKYTLGMELFHYSCVSRSQMEFKSAYYKAGGVNYLDLYDRWQKDHTTPLVNGDRTQEFAGGLAGHPQVIQELILREKNNVK
jgi:hypothetical protein